MACSRVPFFRAQKPRRAFTSTSILWIGFVVYAMGATGSTVHAAELSEVPDVRNRPRAVAEALIRGAGLTLGTVYEMSWRRARDRYAVDVKVGSVIIQNPAPFSGRQRRLPGRAPVRVPRGTRVDLLVSAKNDGLLPKDLPPPSPKARGEIWEQRKRDAKKRSTFRTPDRPAPKDVRREKPKPLAIRKSPVIRTKHAGTPLPKWIPPTPPPSRVIEVETLPVVRDTGELVSDDPTVFTYGDENVLATGSPWGDVASPLSKDGGVPDLLGMSVPHAEQLSRDAKMRLYIQRVPGHPVGRVLKQIPAPGEPPAEGRVIKLYITAGGDYQAYIPGAQSKRIEEIEVPELLDLFEPKARRICRDLGLRLQAKPGKRGLPDRVVDQSPAAGVRAPLGALITVYVAPGRKTSLRDVLGRISKKGSGTNDQAGDMEGAAALKVPVIISPSIGTKLPKQISVVLGFTWHPVPGANAYVVELQERGQGNTWRPNMRKLSKKSAVTLEFDRMGGVTAPVRWRVTPLAGGVQGPESPWTILMP